MLKMIYNAADSDFARRLLNELRADGTQVDDLTGGGAQSKGDVLIPVIGADYKGSSVENAVFEALDNGQQIVPVLNGVEQPKLIDHLDAVAGADTATLKALIARAQSPEASIPLKVLTPRTRRANNQTAFLIAIPVIIMLLVGLIGIGSGAIRRPEDEYNAVETEIVLTRDALIAPELATMEAVLPNNPEEAFVYPATLLAASTPVRPFVALTATARAETTPIYPATVTPTPGS